MPVRPGTVAIIGLPQGMKAPALPTQKYWAAPENPPQEAPPGLDGLNDPHNHSPSPGPSRGLTGSPTLSPRLSRDKVMARALLGSSGANNDTRLPKVLQIKRTHSPEPSQVSIQTLNDSDARLMPFTCEQLILLTQSPTQDTPRESFMSGHEGLRMSGLEALSRPLLLPADTAVDPLAPLMTLPPDLSSHTATHLSGLNLLEQIIARQRAQQVWDEFDEDKNGSLPRDTVLLCSERLLAQFSMPLLLNIKRQLQRCEGPRMPQVVHVNVFIVAA